jgi:hypothetical protein
MTDPPVTTDLQKLANLELPDKSDRHGRAVVKWTILCLTLLLLSCVGGLIYALRASLQREGALSTSLGCVRASAYVYESAVVDSINLLVDLDVPITEALIAVAQGEEEELIAAVSEADKVVNGVGSGKSVIEVKANLDLAIKARQTALDKC